MSKGNPYKEIASLSPRQKEVLQLLCEGKQYKEIAEALFIEESTVKAHMAGVYEKLGLIELNRNERIFRSNPYIAQFSRRRKTGVIDVPYEDIIDESEPDEITPEMDELVSSDEYAIVKFEGENITMLTNPNEGKRKRSGFIRFLRTVFVLIILVMVGFADCSYGRISSQNLKKLQIPNTT